MGAVGGRNFGLPIDLSHRLHNSLLLPHKPWSDYDRCAIGLRDPTQMEPSHWICWPRDWRHRYRPPYICAQVSIALIHLLCRQLWSSDNDGDVILAASIFVVVVASRPLKL